MPIEAWFPAVLSLVGGALGASLVTGFFGKARQQTEMKSEHEKWLRDQKQEAYKEFFDARRHMLDVMVQIPRSAERLERLTELKKKVRPTAIRLLAPEEIADLAQKVYQQVLLLSVQTPDEGPHVDRGLQRCEEDTEHLEALCRADLLP